MRISKLLVLIALFLTISTALSQAEQLRQITVQGYTKSDFLEINRLGLDVLGFKGDSLEMIADQADLDWLDSRGITYRVDIADLKAEFRSMNKANLPMGGYRTLAEKETLMDIWASVYPDIVSDKFSIGTSYEGRDIWAIKISDNPDIDEDEPEILYIGLTHAREPAAGDVLMNFMEHLLEEYDLGADTSILNLVNDRELYFVPVFNPDGYAWNEVTDPAGGGMWRKNRRPNGDSTSFGVDMNRNWGFKWGYDDMGSSPTMDGVTYRGTGPFSEPENQAMRDFIISREFAIIHNMHSHGNLELWPPGYDRVFSQYDDMFSIIGDSMTQYNGYSPQIGWELYPTNGEADGWAWGDTLSKPRILSFTAEIGSSFWPDPGLLSTLTDENIWPNLFLAKIADNPYKFSPPFPPIVAIFDTIVASNYIVDWNPAFDTLNPAVAYELYELTGKQTLIDSAESDNGHWDTEKFTLTNTRQHSGISSWHTLNLNRANHWLVAQTPYLVKTDDSLKFWMWYEIETDWDYFYAQISTDGGYDYVNLPNNMTTNTSPNGLNLGNGITGSSGGWVQAKFDLSAYAGQQVTFRLTYFTDWGTLWEGVYLDDIENVDFFSTEEIVDSGLPVVSYLFFDVPEGEYWYRVKATDFDGQQSPFSNLAKVTVGTEYIKGDANNDGDINILDLTYMVDYIFRSGPVPAPLLAGDANCDDDSNILDLTYLVDYIFRSGPIPDCS